MEFRALVAAGKPAVLKKSMQVLRNDWWGIPSYEVEPLDSRCEAKNLLRMLGKKSLSN